MHTLAAQLGQTLLKANKKLVTVESCTGGGLGFWITSVAGSSHWFERGFITYSNEAKIELVHVKASTLNEHGAVSEATAREMAEGGLKNSQSDVCLSITGIAGPDGGTPTKPIGTVWMGLAEKNKTTLTFHAVFTGDRQALREAAIHAALSHLLNTV
jgi:nicotinamide-nucleotide amidase